MPIRPLRVFAALPAIVLIVPSALSAQAPSIEDVTSRMAAYVTDFSLQFANVVAAETYDQTYRVRGASLNTQGSLPASRRLQSDFLLVRSPLTQIDWMVFRDVAAVDGTTVRHQSDRLLKLFAESNEDVAARAAQINLESARFHVPGASVAVTNPLLVVALMHPYYQPRLRFRLGGEERSLGAGVRVVQFEEVVARRTGEGRASGTVAPILDEEGTIKGNVWVDAGSGRIVKTEGRIAGPLRNSTTITTFTRDEKLALTVPSEMRTTWVYADGKTTGGPVNGVAKYGNFRRFDVKTDTLLLLPQQP